MYRLPKLRAAGRVPVVEIDDRVVERPGKWSDIVVAVETMMPEAQRLIDLVYIDRAPWHRVCEELAVEKSTFYAWRKNLVTFVALFACQEGLASVYATKKEGK